eukprot:7386826-Prymnesium_polylepis.2
MCTNSRSGGRPGNEAGGGDRCCCPGCWRTRVRSERRREYFVTFPRMWAPCTMHRGRTRETSLVVAMPVWLRVNIRFAFRRGCCVRSDRAINSSFFAFRSVRSVCARSLLDFAARRVPPSVPLAATARHGRVGRGRRLFGWSCGCNMPRRALEGGRHLLLCETKGNGLSWYCRIAGQHEQGFCDAAMPGHMPERDPLLTGTAMVGNWHQWVEHDVDGGAGRMPCPRQGGVHAGRAPAWHGLCISQLHPYPFSPVDADAMRGGRDAGGFAEAQPRLPAPSQGRHMRHLIARSHASAHLDIC